MLSESYPKSQEPAETRPKGKGAPAEAGTPVKSL